MKPTICICCGEPMVEHGNALSRNPNICASCSSLADGMDENDDFGIATAVLPESPGVDARSAMEHHQAKVAVEHSDE